MVNKKVVVICSIIALVTVLLVIGIKIKKFKETDYASEENIINISNKVETQNSSKNEAKEENVIKENEKNTENITEENVSQTQVQGEEETKTEEKQENNEDGKDKALRLVKKEWGEDDTVYYTIDNQSNNIYNISVRSKSTTATLAEYEVDVNEETVMIK